MSRQRCSTCKKRGHNTRTCGRDATNDVKGRKYEKYLNQKLRKVSLPAVGKACATPGCTRKKTLHRDHMIEVQTFVDIMADRKDECNPKVIAKFAKIVNSSTNFQTLCSTCNIRKGQLVKFCRLDDEDEDTPVGTPATFEAVRSALSKALPGVMKALSKAGLGAFAVDLNDTCGADFGFHLSEK